MREPVDVADEIYQLLLQLCEKHGFCSLEDEAFDRLCQTVPPFDIDTFTDEVFLAEGLDPRLYKQLRHCVRETVERGLTVLTAKLHGDPLGTYAATVKRIDRNVKARRDIGAYRPWRRRRRRKRRY
jgi:hypothetical protein